MIHPPVDHVVFFVQIYVLSVAATHRLLSTLLGLRKALDDVRISGVGDGHDRDAEELAAGGAKVNVV